MLDPGSSPRMRGAHHPLLDSCLPHGIIPADAGSTTECNTDCALDRDHPRGCGEHQTVHPARPHADGSSPRMRGARPEYHDPFGMAGIIPADAGSTTSCRVISTRIRDHPRGCGEHPRNSMSTPVSAGSSPRMRGAPNHRPRHGALSRIIPADAGSTQASGQVLAAYGDHPRGCGEH